MNNSILYSVKVGGFAVEKRNIQNLIDSIFRLSKLSNYEIHIFYSDELKPDVYNFIKSLNYKFVKIFNKKKFSWFDWLNITKDHSRISLIHF